MPFPHTRLGSQSLAGGGIFHRVGSKQELSRAGPKIQRDSLSLWLVAHGEAAAAAGSLSKGNPVPPGVDLAFAQCLRPEQLRPRCSLQTLLICSPGPWGTQAPLGRITERVGLRPHLAFWTTRDPPRVSGAPPPPLCLVLSLSLPLFLCLCLPSPIPVVTCTCFSASLNLSNPQAVNSQGSPSLIS